MTPILLFLAQIDVRDTLAANMHKNSVSRSGLTLLFAALGIVTLLILTWAAFIRKRPLARSRRFSHSASKDNVSLSTANNQGRRRRRRRSRSRNPTLAETGGLPPIRREGYSEDTP